MRIEEFTAKDGGRVAWMLGRFELFGSLTPEQLLKLAPFVSFRTYEAGEVVIEKDDAGDAFFGELALLLSQPRSASVVCREASELFVLMSGDFARLLEGEPEVGALVKQIAKARFEDRA